MNLICSYQVCAGHQLTRPEWSQDQNEKAFGKCANVHGHQYTIELVLSGNIDPQTGMVINSHAVDDIVRPFIQKNLDHKFLNTDVAFFKETPSTAEWIAVWIFDELKKLFPQNVTLKKVRVRETPDMYVEYDG